jgi:hypothetical protein
MLKIEIFIPQENLGALTEALHQAGAGKIGRYDHCLSVMHVKGTWRPLVGAEPFLGRVGELCTGEEVKVEVNCPQENIQAALQAIRRVHPYEEPVINVLQLLDYH